MQSHDPGPQWCVLFVVLKATDTLLQCQCTRGHLATGGCGRGSAPRCRQSHNLHSGSLQSMSILLLRKLLAPNKRAQLLPLAAVDHLRLLDQAPNQERGFEGTELLTTRFQ